MQRRVVREHHPAGADAHGPGHGGDLPDEEGGDGGGDPGHVVVLGEPETAKPEPLDVPGQLEGVLQSFMARHPRRDGGQLEHGEGNIELGHVLECRRV
jgi:hypothetical protein